jgi:hypothetical protein
MTSSPLSCRLLISVSVAILAWIVIISFGLKFLFGAGPTGGWLIVGIMFTIVLAGMMMLAREFKESFLVPAQTDSDISDRPRAASKRRLPARSSCREESFPHFPDGPFFETRRAALGLGIRHAHSNFRRSRHQKPASRDTAALSG